MITYANEAIYCPTCDCDADDCTNPDGHNWDWLTRREAQRKHTDEARLDAAGL